MTFDGNFMLGAATSAHQVEGNNVHSDYWVQENLEHSSFLEPSNIACDHYNRYEEDIRMLKSAGLNAYRFSIEWARIEPEKGEFDENEINHYRQVIDCCKEMGVEPIVTLLHFTSPAWLIKEGGWESEKVIEYFARYTSYVIEKLGDRLAYVCTINEANMGLQLAAIAKRYEMMAKAAQNMKEPPAESGKEAEGKVQVGMNFQKMMENMKYQAAENMQAFGTPQPQTFVSARTPEGDMIVMKAHQAAKKEIKKLYPDIRVGITLSLHDLQAVEGGEKYVRDTWDEEFVHYLPYIKDDDFLGVQNYTRTVYGANGQLNPKEDAKLTQMEYEIYPQALEHVIRQVNKDFKGDIIVTENGIAITDDEIRCKFIDDALQGVKNCIDDNIPVKGYCYWSLLDNFEWQKGYSMTFGLIAVDRDTMKREEKPSLRHLGSYI